MKKGNPRKIQEAFESYALRVIPDGAGPAQKSATKLAFFGGALIAFKTVTKAAELPEEEAVQVLNDLQAEFDAYLEAMEPKQ